MRELIYLTIPKPNRSFAIGIASQFMHNRHIDHWNVIHIPRYTKKAPIKDYCTRISEATKFLDTNMLNNDDYLLMYNFYRVALVVSSMS